eukprot:TRINITY_DN4958_c0_g2_i1.p1 TRINITY_DN4958_c0_g2~~TRINITY_DN4958_c0_g2_i1.p1  ORF type:complete len:404 (+),score=90.10 TRINITY_DN4958_c0_g2_i1:368-1579(+)
MADCKGRKRFALHLESMPRTRRHRYHNKCNFFVCAVFFALTSDVAVAAAPSSLRSVVSNAVSTDAAACTCKCCASSYRTPAKQVQGVEQMCSPTPGSSTCGAQCAGTGTALEDYSAFCLHSCIPPAGQPIGSWCETMSSAMQAQLNGADPAVLDPPDAVSLPAELNRDAAIAEKALASIPTPPVAQAPAAALSVPSAAPALAPDLQVGASASLPQQPEEAAQASDVQSEEEAEARQEAEEAVAQRSRALLKAQAGADRRVAWAQGSAAKAAALEARAAAAEANSARLMANTSDAVRSARQRMKFAESAKEEILASAARAREFVAVAQAAERQTRAELVEIEAMPQEAIHDALVKAQQIFADETRTLLNEEAPYKLPDAMSQADAIAAASAAILQPASRLRGGA